jgi:adenosylmethionine-8-amino-7-oxononanoate aminotransferase
MWCVNVGHRNQALADALRAQAMELTYSTPWYTSNNPAEKLARMLADRAPGDLKHVFFTTGGSSAVETALRLIQFYNNVRGRPDKKLIVSRQGSYHGSTYLSGSLNGRPRDHDWMDGASTLCRRLSCPDPFHRPAGLSVAAFEDSLEAEFRTLISNEGADRIGAFIAEPV